MLDADPILVYERYLAAMQRRDAAALRACLHGAEPATIERVLAPARESGAAQHRYVIACCIDGDTATLETAASADGDGSGSIALVHDGSGWRLDAQALFADEVRAACSVAPSPRVLERSHKAGNSPHRLRCLEEIP